MKSRFCQTGWLASVGAPLHLRLSWEPTRAAMATVELARRATRRTSRTMALPLARATSSAATSAFPAAAAAYNTQKMAPRSAARMNCLLLAAPSTFPPFASRNAALTSISAIARGTFSRWMDLKGEGGKGSGSCYTCSALSCLTIVSSFDDCSVAQDLLGRRSAHFSRKRSNCHRWTGCSRRRLQHAHCHHHRTRTRPRRANRQVHARLLPVPARHQSRVLYWIG